MLYITKGYHEIDIIYFLSNDMFISRLIFHLNIDY